MTTLAEIRVAQEAAQTLFDQAWNEAMQALSTDDAGRQLAARLTGHRRELEALTKVESQIIAHGRPSPISDLPPSIS